MGAIVATAEALRAFADALIDTQLPSAEIARELFTIANLVERRHPDAANRFGRALLKAGYTRELADSLVQRFSVAQFVRTALAAALTDAAEAHADLHGICCLCFGGGCDECADLEAEARDYDQSERWQEAAA